MLLDELVTNMVYTPPEAHGRPTLFEARLTLPAAAKLELFMDVVKGFLQYTEHLLDAQPVLIPIQTRFRHRFGIYCLYIYII